MQYLKLNTHHNLTVDGYFKMKLLYLHRPDFWDSHPRCYYYTYIYHIAKYHLNTLLGQSSMLQFSHPFL